MGSTGRTPQLRSVLHSELHSYKINSALKYDPVSWVSSMQDKLQNRTATSHTFYLVKDITKNNF